MQESTMNSRGRADWRPPALPLHLAMSSGSSSTVFLGTFTGGPGGGMASDHGPSESEGIYCNPSTLRECFFHSTLDNPARGAHAGHRARLGPWR